MAPTDQRVYVEQIRILYDQTPTAVLGGGVVAGLLAWILADVTNAWLLASWLLSLWLVLGLRMPPYFAFKRLRPDYQEMNVWGRKYMAMSALHGLWWGAAPWLFLQGTEPMYLFIVALWVVGMSAASISAYAAYYRAMVAFILPVLGPTIVYLLINPHPYSLPLALGLTTYLVVVLRSALPINRAMIATIRSNQDMENEIAERKNAEKELQVQAREDALTGLANRRHFDDVLSRELLRAGRDNYPLSLVLLDIDYFKSFNDTYGHPAGDKCLRQVAQTVQSTLKRAGDLAARYGGEELAVVLPHASADQAHSLAEKIRSSVQALAISNAGSRIPRLDVLTLSAGVATWNQGDPLKTSNLISRADERLYQAKAQGRNQVVGNQKQH